MSESFMPANVKSSLHLDKLFTVLLHCNWNYNSVLKETFCSISAIFKTIKLIVIFHTTFTEKPYLSNLMLHQQTC